MRSMSSKIIFYIVLIAQKYSGKVDLWGALRISVLSGSTQRELKSPVKGGRVDSQ